jgi:hypothetical protein
MGIRVCPGHQNLLVETRRLDSKRRLDRKESDMLQVISIETVWILRFPQYERPQRRATSREERDHQERRSPQDIMQVSRGSRRSLHRVDDQAPARLKCTNSRDVWVVERHGEWSVCMHCFRRVRTIGRRNNENARTTADTFHALLLCSPRIGWARRGIDQPENRIRNAKSAAGLATDDVQHLAQGATGRQRIADACDSIQRTAFAARIVLVSATGSARPCDITSAARPTARARGTGRIVRRVGPKIP